MRVLITSETLHAGGAETFVLRLCRKLQQEGIRCELLNLNPDIENKGLINEYRDVTIHRVSLPFLKLIKKFDSGLLKLNIDFSLQLFLTARWIEKTLLKEFDVFHTHLIKVDYLFSILKEKYPNLKIIATVHGDYAAFYAKNSRGESIRWLNFENKLELIKKNVNKWVTITDEQLDFFTNVLSISPTRVNKFYNGLEASITADLEKKKQNKYFIIGMVARGVMLKGWDVLIEAFINMPKDCQLRLVGSGDYIDKLIGKYKNHERIIFTGFNPNPVREIINFDVFVLPSLFPYESLPNVITEALSCGKPVIATRVGEIPTMITDPETGDKAGFLLDFDGSMVKADQLHNYLLKYYRDKSLIHKHSEVALKAYAKFNMKTCVKNYTQVYLTL